MSAYLLVVDLSGDKPQVLRRFEQHRAKDIVLGQRVIKGRSRSAQVEDVEMNVAGEVPVSPPKESTTGEAMAVDEDAEPPSKADEEDETSSDEDFHPLPLPPILPTITRLAISPDGQYLASVSTSSSPHTTTTRTHIYNLDSITYTSTLPSFPSPIQALAFTSTPTSPHSYTSLVLGLADNSIHVYDVESRTFPLWAKESTGAGVPRRVRGLHDPILGVTFDGSVLVDHPANGGQVKADPLAPIFWGATWLCRVNLAAGGVSREDGGGFEKRKKRKWGGKKLAERKGLSSGMNAIALGSGHTSTLPTSTSTGEGTTDEPHMRQDNFKIVTTYRPLLFVEFVGGEKELVVVERPLVDVLNKLPPAFFKPKYGAT